ncbi:MAG TPA: VWA domain-containing protein [Pyrinomonadaceae bacterium]|nr:VWA domain-containing protein [Pyrinomonadaceae bacterium]
MKKIVPLILCVGLLSLAVFAQSGRSRPRVVVTDNLPNSQNQTTPSDPNSQTTSPTPTPETTKRPPVLIGDTKSTPSTSTTNSKESEVIEDDEVIKVETNLVTIPVTVLDRDGRFVSGLQKQNFQIFEDGMQQQVEYFASLETPFTVILLLDVSASTQFKIEEIQNAAITFVNQLRQNDRVAVISFDEKIHVLAEATNNRAVLRDAILQAKFGGGTSLYEAVDFAINKQLRNIQGRKAVVLFTDGVETTSKRATYQTTVKEAEELDAMVYPIRYDTSIDMNSGMGGGGTSNPPQNRRRGGGGWGQIIGAILTGGSVNIGGGGGIGGSKEDYEKAQKYLQDLAQASGGRNFDASSTYNLDSAFAGIAEELRRQYSIGYYPEKAGQPGQRKQIKVRVDKTNAVVRAKNSYIVGGNGSPSPTTATKQAPKPTMKNRLPF